MEKHPREDLYFYLRVLFSCLFVLGAGGILLVSADGFGFMFAGFAASVLLYVGLFVLYFIVANWILVGYLRGNGVLLGEHQFPEVHAMVVDIAGSFGLPKLPKVFLVESGGALNAFAVRFAGKNYIALYSDVLEQGEQDPGMLKFILAHEMAHIKENHVRKRFWTGLSFYVPLLSQAYSRACEYTCDGYGARIAKGGAKNGLLMLAAGRKLYRKVNPEQYRADYENENTAIVRLVGKLSSHPDLPRRLAYVDSISP